MFVEERRTVRFIQGSENSDEPPDTTEEVIDFVLSVGEFLTLRRTDGYPSILSVDPRWKGGSYV